MGDWVERFVQEKKDEQAQLAHVREVLPIRASQFWASLCQELEADIMKLNEHFRGEIGQICFQVTQPAAIRVSKLDYPAYYIDLTKQYDTIRVDVEIAQSLNNSKKRNPAFLKMELDKNDNLLVSFKDIEKITASFLSELVLRLILEPNQPMLF